MIRFLLFLLEARSDFAPAAALAAEPNASPGYPPGLFENSPVIGSQPDAAAPGAPGGEPGLDDCAGIESRVFRSLAEVRAAHARCDPRSNPGEPD